VIKSFLHCINSLFPVQWT